MLLGCKDLSEDASSSLFSIFVYPRQFQGFTWK